MIRIVLCGAAGRMGKKITECVSEAEDMRIVAGIDQIIPVQDPGYPVYKAFERYDREADVVIDFSSPAMLEGVLGFCTSRKIPAVLGATGYTDEDLEKIREASGVIPVFRSANMSVGVQALRVLSRCLADMLPDFEIEIVERHHDQKKDAPSGTALTLLNDVKKDDTVVKYGREGRNVLREKREIGVHAIRGGTLAGEHEVGFYGSQETLLLTHRAQDRSVFAYGALRAARFIVDRREGEYDMNDLLPFDRK